MKKALLLVSLSMVGASFAQDCSELFISEYVEGSGNDKALEIYNPTGLAINLSGYRIERFANGQASSAAGGVLNLVGTIQPHAAFVIVNGQTVTQPNSPAASPALQLLADQLDGVYPAPTYMNGNDAIVLFKNTNIIDIFARTGDASITSARGWSDEFPYDGSEGTVWTENHTLIRKPNVLRGVTVNPDPFVVTTQYDSLPENTWTNLGTHVCNCPLSLEESNTVSFVVFPNPAAAGTIKVVASENIVAVEVVDMLGQVVVTERFTDISKYADVNTSLLNKGVYVVRVSYDTNTFTQSSLIIQ